jgi:putative MATE family efflux protein
MNEKIDLVSLPKKSFWKLSIPIIAFCIFDAIYGIVDMVWVSQIGVEAFFAMGVTIPIVSWIFSFGDSIGQGTNSMMSRFIGSGDYESAYNTLIHGMILANIIWVVIVICLVFANGIIYYLDKADSYILVFDYLVPIVVFAYVFIFVNLFSETLQAEGNSRTPTILIIASNILNMILDPIFIFNLNLGIKGAAYATVLSTMLIFVIFFYLYLSGRTKVPLSARYFKFRGYILVEIFKVALPNFLDDGLWCLLTSFINSMLVMSMGPMGPILYSVANKIKTLLIAPVRGYGRGLMSVTGHLFGAHKFDDLSKMYKYALSMSFITTFVVMVVFVIFREYIFSLFSITGMETEIFWIAIGGTVIMLTIPFSMISAKMLDGFGKSMYSLLFTIIKVIFEMILVYGLFSISSDASCVLIGIMVSEFASSIIYCLFLRHLFKNFDQTYENRDTVKNFQKSEEIAEDSESSDESEVKSDVSTSDKAISKTPLILALLSMAFVVLEIISLPIRMNNWPMFASGIIALIGGAICIYLMERLNKPKLSVIGFIFIGVLLFIFMGRHGYIATLLFIVTGVMLFYIKMVLKKLENKDITIGE